MSLPVAGATPVLPVLRVLPALLEALGEGDVGTLLEELGCGSASAVPSPPLQPFSSTAATTVEVARG